MLKEAWKKKEKRHENEVGRKSLIKGIREKRRKKRKKEAGKKV